MSDVFPTAESPSTKTLTTESCAASTRAMKNELKKNVTMWIWVLLLWQSSLAVILNVCGIDYSTKETFCAVDTNGVLGTFTKLSGNQAMYLAMHGNVLYKSDENRDVWKGDVGGNWVQLGFKQRHLSFDGTSLCAIDDLGSKGLVCTEDDGTSWSLLNPLSDYQDRKINAVSGIKQTHRMYHIPRFGSVQGLLLPFEHQNGNLIQVSYDGSTLCGVTANLKAYCTSSGLPHTPVWTNLNGDDFHYIQVQNDMLYAIRGDNREVYTSSYPAVSWTAVNKQFSTLALSIAP